MSIDLDKIVGHQRQITLLKNDLEKENLSHSYLFCGPSHIGKSIVADSFANFLLENSYKNSHLIDIVKLEDDNHSIKISQIRKLIERAHMTSQSPFKIFIIENIERMTKEAANAFLKILEEPSEDTIFLLTTDNISSILETIISRTRLLRFSALDKENIKNFISQKAFNVEDEFLEELVFLCNGLPGLIESFVSTEERVERAKDIISFSKKVISGDLYFYQLFAKIEEISKDKKVLNDFIFIFESLLRKKLLNSLKAEHREEVKTYLLKKLKKLENCKKMFLNNINSRLLLENLILQN